MRKQYKVRYVGLKTYFHLYHDGDFVGTNSVWQGDETEDERERLEADGYTYGYLNREVEEAKQRYEHMLANMIEVTDE